MSPSDLTVLGACPLDCPDTCAWSVTVRDGVAVDLRGSRSHPFTKGALCAKVNKYLDHAGSPDRLLYPLRRTGPKGSGRFARISWDEALDEMATRLSAVVAEDGGEAIWPYYGTGSMGYLQGLGGRAFGRFWNVLGASRHDPYGICSKAGAVGQSYVLGSTGGIDPETLSEAKLILLWGANPLSTGHHGWKFVQQARRRGAHVVAIDPVRTRTTDQADEHLAPVPGTDAALALGLLHEVVRLGLEDRDYLERFTIGWPEFRERIGQYPPDRVERITGVPQQVIVALGKRLATTRPTAIRASMGLQRHAGGGATMRVLACLPAVTGDWGRVGGGLAYSTGAHFRLNEAALIRDDLLPHPVRTLSMTRLAEGLLDLTDPPVKALFVVGANPAVSSPDQYRIRRGLSREDLFTVVLDHFQTDTADYADLVLPSTNQLEHLDLHDAYGHLYLAWNEKATEPAGECLSTTETFRRLAGRMGLTEPSLYEPDEELAAQLVGAERLTRLRADGWMRLPLPAPFVPYGDGFPTPSGKAEFRSARAEADGLDPLPGYVPALEVSDPDRAERYPLVLIAAASHYFLNTVFGNHPELRRRAGEPRLMIHPVDAAARGIADGDRVRVRNDRGEFTLVAELSDRVRPGVVATTKGWWTKAGVNATTAERDTDLGGGAVFHDNRVQLIKETTDAVRDN